MSQNSPRIAVSYAMNSPAVSARYSETLKQLADSTVQSLSALGAHVRVIDAVTGALSPQEILDQHDGLLVLGGADIDPSLYGQEPEQDALDGVNRDADVYEISLITAAQRARMPVLGICRGMQLINVAAGGTLIQDLPGPNQHRAEAASGQDRFTDHSVALVPETRLADTFAGRTALPIRSSHHQAVDEVGAGLVVNAYSDDQVIEGLERAEPWVLAVQWHPEEAQAEQEQFNRLLLTFIESCPPR